MAKKKKQNSGGIFQKLEKKISSKPQTLGLESLEQVTDFILGIKKETYVKTAGIFVLLYSILSVFSLFNLGGFVGQKSFDFFITNLGFWGYLSSLPFFYISFYLLKVRVPQINFLKLGGLILFILSTLSFYSLLNIGSVNSTEKALDFSGFIGHFFSEKSIALFSLYPSFIFSFILSFLGLFIAFDYFPKMITLNIKDTWLKIVSSFDNFSFSTSFFSNHFYTIKDKIMSIIAGEYPTASDEEIETGEDIRSEILYKKARKEKKAVILDEEIVETKNINVKNKNLNNGFVEKIKIENKRQEQKVIQNTDTSFTPPPLSLLQRDSGKPATGDLKLNASVIKRTLSEFGISVEMDEVSVGPSVTRYALKPAQGVKLSKIAGHRQELAYALEAESIRIEAPIPGKSLVGIEIPNEKKAMVGLGSLLSAPEWQDPKPLLLALGKGVSGIPVFGNLSKMPHLLIAGTTGSGKSVMVHAIINSLLFRNSPSDLKFIMVDPKKVELTLYNNIPHLYTPVITNAKVAIRTLNWAVNEMERRYDILESFTERDITSYHKNVFQKAVLKEKNNPDAFLPERMPYIVVIIDELADIMMSYPKELESAIVRLAQKSRAVGIHLILSTQRPSVNVITGLIKANIPSRIALKVASQIDSRTIIDTGGAEQLLGQGDLLFTSSENPKQERVQSAFVSDQEVKKVVEYLKDKYRNMIPDEINVESAPAGTSTSVLYGADFEKAAGGDDEDDLYEEAKEIVISSRKASTSYLQRRLKIGYSRAARLMDMLEDKGIIGAGDGAKPREVLVEGGEVESEDYNNTNF